MFFQVSFPSKLDAIAHEFAVTAAGASAFSHTCIFIAFKSEKAIPAFAYGFGKAFGAITVQLAEAHQFRLSFAPRRAVPIFALFLMS
jgi:hypothetical protein